MAISLGQYEIRMASLTSEFLLSSPSVSMIAKAITLNNISYRQLAAVRRAIKGSPERSSGRPKIKHHGLSKEDTEQSNNGREQVADVGIRQMDSIRSIE